MSDKCLNEGHTIMRHNSVSCPYCHITELEAENASLRESLQDTINTLREVTSVKPSYADLKAENKRLKDILRKVPCQNNEYAMRNLSDGSCCARCKALQGEDLDGLYN